MSAVIAIVSGVITWIVARLEWWRDIENKYLKAAVAVGVFLAFAFILSIITAPIPSTDRSF
jgi:hypothetical protein